HGQRIFAALMLAIVSPGALGWITLLLNAAVLLSVLIPALMRSSGETAWRERGFAAIAGTLLLFSGLWLWGIYFSFGLSDLVLAVKIALVTNFVDPGALADFRSGLSVRVGSSFVASIPLQEIDLLARFNIDAASLERSWFLSALYMLARLGYATFVIGYGSP